MCMKSLFTLDDIKFKTDKPTYARAVVLYDSGKVVEVERGSLVYSAVVCGTHRYRVSIDLKRFGFGNCDCYLGENDVLCKHIVALSLHAVMDGGTMSAADKKQVLTPVCSGTVGDLSDQEFSEVKKVITSAMRHIREYTGPSSTWFAYQNSLDEGCGRLAAVVSALPAGERSSRLLVSMLLRLDRKLTETAVDDSNGTVGGFMQEVVSVLQEYAALDPRCVTSFKKLRNRDTCFGWEETLIDMLK